MYLTRRIVQMRAACASVDADPTRLPPAFTCASAQRVPVSSMPARYVARAPLLCIGYFCKIAMAKNGKVLVYTIRFFYATHKQKR